MKIVDGKRMGSVTVFEDTLLLGEVVGDVILNAGHLELKGKVLGNLFVRKGTCRLFGIVRGNLENEAGDLEVFGAVHGKVVTKNGYTYVNPGSKVGAIENAPLRKETASNSVTSNSSTATAGYGNAGSIS